MNPLERLILDALRLARPGLTSEGQAKWIAGYIREHKTEAREALS